MHTRKYPLSPPTLSELAETLKVPLSTNYDHSTVSVITCPDLRNAPFHLATPGISGDEKIADVGRQANLFPRPRLDKIYSMPELAKAMEMGSERGGLLGAGAGPFHVIGRNCELAPNFSWEGGFENVDNRTRVIQIRPDTGGVGVGVSPSVDCALMVNLYGSLGEAGEVIRITARKRRGAEKSFTECIQKALKEAYGDSQTISLGGVFVVRSGKARYHVMPDFPPENELPFKNRKQLEEWLTYHDFGSPMVCLSVLHSADPDKLGLRMEHTHCFSAEENAGGHYHYDLKDEEVEYEGYFNTAKVLYRVDAAEA
ncbi:hypothetical protein MW887_003082 [Aspergillus wentii]|nr:hypothetical protein MW887_003082 [Aspergillus wentii]